MQLGELGERLDEVELREPQRDEIDVGPRHEVAAAPRQAAREEAETEAPRQGAGAGVDAAHDEAAVAGLEQHVLHAHEHAAAHVEHLVVEHRVDERELVAAERGRLEVGGEAREVQLLGVDVDLGDLLPRGADLSSSRSTKKPVTTAVVGGAEGDHIEQLADLRAGGVDDGHVFELGEGERAWVVVHGNESHPFAGGAPAGRGEDTRAARATSMSDRL